MKKPLRFFLIRNGTQYLYENKSRFRGGYYFKYGKQGAAMFDRAQSRKVLTYLKKQGHFDVERIKA